MVSVYAAKKGGCQAGGCRLARDRPPQACKLVVTQAQPTLPVHERSHLYQWRALFERSEPLAQSVALQPTGKSPQLSLICSHGKSAGKRLMQAPNEFQFLIVSSC